MLEAVPLLPHRGKITDGVRAKTKTVGEMKKNARKATRNAATAEK